MRKQQRSDVITKKIGDDILCKTPNIDKTDIIANIMSPNIDLNEYSLLNPSKNKSCFFFERKSSSILDKLATNALRKSTNKEINKINNKQEEETPFISQTMRKLTLSEQKTSCKFSLEDRQEVKNLKIDEEIDEDLEL